MQAHQGLETGDVGFQQAARIAELGDGGQGPQRLLADLCQAQHMRKGACITHRGHLQVLQGRHSVCFQPAGHAVHSGSLAGARVEGLETCWLQGTMASSITDPLPPAHKLCLIWSAPASKWRSQAARPPENVTLQGVGSLTMT